MKPLVLSVKRGRFRFDDPGASKSDAIFKTMRPKALERDNFTCQFCGFRAARFQEVHHLNDNHDDSRLENLITACVLCHMAHHIGFAGHSKRGCLIVLDPGLGLMQAELNQIVRTLWIAESSDDKATRLHSLTLLARIYKHATAAKRALGSSDPTVLGDYLLGLDDKSYASRGAALQGVYLLPLKAEYEKHIEYWRKSAYHGLPVRTWTEQAQSKFSQWALLGDE